MAWYNPFSWKFFGYTNPDTGEYTEVETTVGGRNTKAGVHITHKTAMGIPLVWTCVKILSETVAGLPLKLYEGDGKERKLVDPMDRMVKLLKKPNPHITKLNFLKCVVANMALRGNAFALIHRNRFGEVVGLTPLNPDDVDRDHKLTDSLLYLVRENGKIMPVSPENMLHFKIFSLDGIWGLSPVEHLAETMGLSQAGQEWSSRFMSKGGFTGGYVIYKDFLTERQRNQIMAKFPNIRKEGNDDFAKMGVLEGGPSVVPAGLSQKDSQFIETQQFTEEQISGIWGVPLYLANRASKTSIMGSNLEQQMSSFTVFGLKPYLDAVRDEIDDKLLPKTDRFTEFVVEGLLQADSAGRAAYYRSALGGSSGPGWMSIDEVREKENLPEFGGEYSEITRWELNNGSSKDGSTV